MPKNKISTLIYGAGTAGVQLCKALEISTDFKIVGFVDDNPKLTNTKVSKYNVYGVEKINELIKSKDLDQVIFAILNISPQQRDLILKRLSKLDINVSIMPSFKELIQGKSLTDLKDININRLLGRSIVEPSKDLLVNALNNRIICVTGAGGSIGSEIAMQALDAGVKILILYELSEAALHIMHQKLILRAANLNLNIKIIPIIGSVQDEKRFQHVLTQFNVETVFHAAAYKHVPLVEHNIIPSIKNNVLGTLKAGRACQNSNVERFVLISTDKAVRATNVMGATKRLAEQCIQFLGEDRNFSTIFCSVRFGNVLGSSGSVVPVFHEQIKVGGPVTVTHPEIMRYFMTLSEAASLVIQAGSIARGQEVFVLDMGKPVNIFELAKKMVSLNGLTVKDAENPEGDIEIKFTGLRPGEKLFEEPLAGLDAIETLHPKIMCETNNGFNKSCFKANIVKLEDAIKFESLEVVLTILKELVKDYQPNTRVIDYLL